MARTVTRERDLRSLDRPGLRRAFRPLDAEERLPLELVREPGIAVSGVGRRAAVLLWPAALLIGLALVVLAARLGTG
jgi:hypothetical protein